MCHGVAVNGERVPLQGRTCCTVSLRGGSNYSGTKPKEAELKEGLVTKCLTRPAFSCLLHLCLRSTNTPACFPAIGTQQLPNVTSVPGFLSKRSP